MTFYKWAISSGYNDSLTLDRIENDGNYEPSNCRWETKSIQNINRRRFDNTSGYIGVYQHSSHSRWVATIKIDGKQIYLGMSSDILDAVKMRNEYIDEHNLPNKKNEVIS
jgi:hypothetical protein